MFNKLLVCQPVLCKGAEQYPKQTGFLPHAVDGLLRGAERHADFFVFGEHASRGSWVGGRGSRRERNFSRPHAQQRARCGSRSYDPEMMTEPESRVRRPSDRVAGVLNFVLRGRHCEEQDHVNRQERPPYGGQGSS